MSEELEWELYDVFEAGLFAFPLYEHQTARKIVRYLIYRGVLEEEIADAIEDSTIDLHVWLNRQGKNMVGEWVIAWVNDVRDEYLAEKEREARENGYELRDTISRDRRSLSHEATSTDGDAPDGGLRGICPRRRHPRPHRLIRHDDSGSTASESNSDFDEETEVKRPISPPPLPPRTLQRNRRAANSDDILHLRHIDSSTDTESIRADTRQGESEDEDDVMRFSTPPPPPISPPRSPDGRESPDPFQHTPDSGAVSDIYSTIPGECAQDFSPGGGPRGTGDFPGGVTRDLRKLCPNCTCSVPHYAYLHKTCPTSSYQPPSTPSSRPLSLSPPPNNDTNGNIESISVMTPLRIDTGGGDCTSPAPSAGGDSGRGGDGDGDEGEGFVSVEEGERHRPLGDRHRDRHRDWSVGELDIHRDGECDRARHTDTSNNPNRDTTNNPNRDTTNNPNRDTPNTPNPDAGYMFSESTLRAMELRIDTLDRDGPGYIFIMTDSLENCLPWSSEHRYKVGASRRPERFVTEFRALNISIELIWQVRVEHHMKAVREIHHCLDNYNLHSNWFKCSLSVIMDTISKTVRKYRSA